MRQLTPHYGATLCQAVRHGLAYTFSSSNELQFRLAMEALRKPKKVQTAQPDRAVVAAASAAPADKGLARRGPARVALGLLLGVAALSALGWVARAGGLPL